MTATTKNRSAFVNRVSEKQSDNSNFITRPVRTRDFISVGGVMRILLSLAFVIPLTMYAAEPIGWVDNIDNNGTIYGWAKDPDLPNAPIAVHIYRDGNAYSGGTFVGAAWADHFHDATVGSHGFRFTLPEEV